MAAIGIGGEIGARTRPAVASKGVKPAGLSTAPKNDYGAAGLSRRRRFHFGKFLINAIEDRSADFDPLRALPLLPPSIEGPAGAEASLLFQKTRVLIVFDVSGENR